jgi:hypothetical protein
LEKGGASVKVRKLVELIQIIAAVNDARIDERRGFGWHAGRYPGFGLVVNGAPEKQGVASE